MKKSRIKMNNETRGLVNQTVRITKTMKDTKAFVIATLVSSFCYWLITIALHRYEHGVMPHMSIGFFLLILLFASAGTIFIAIPIYHILLKTKYNKNWLIVLLGTAIGGAIVGSSHNGILWQHPEGFIVGLIAALTFITFKEKNA